MAAELTNLQHEFTQRFKGEFDQEQNYIQMFNKESSAYDLVGDSYRLTEPSLRWAQQTSDDRTIELTAERGNIGELRRAASELRAERASDPLIALNHGLGFCYAKDVG